MTNMRISSNEVSPVSIRGTISRLPSGSKHDGSTDGRRSFAISCFEEFPKIHFSSVSPDSAIPFQRLLCSFFPAMARAFYFTLERILQEQTEITAETWAGRRKGTWDF